MTNEPMGKAIEPPQEETKIDPPAQPAKPKKHFNTAAWVFGILFFITLAALLLAIMIPRIQERRSGDEDLRAQCVEALEEFLDERGIEPGTIRERLAAAQAEYEALQEQVETMCGEDGSSAEGMTECSEYDLPVVVFTAAGAISQDDKDAVQEMIVEPMVMYYENIDQQILTIRIEPGDFDDEGERRPESVETIMATGGSGDFLIDYDGNEIDWWIPECMGDCEYSAEFEELYPEIVEATNG